MAGGSSLIMLGLSSSAFEKSSRRTSEQGVGEMKGDVARGRETLWVASDFM